jgi:hypothetical protein
VKPQRPGLPIAWAVVWVGAAAFPALPGQNTGEAVASELTAGTDAAHGWLASLDNSVATWATQHGVLVLPVLVGRPGHHRHRCAGARDRGARRHVRLVLTPAIWVLGQNLGMLYTGQATDPNSGPVLAVLGLVLLAGSREIGPNSR